MGFVSRFAFAAALTGTALLAAQPALAGCKRMGFTVNDYGKDGPTKDAQDLLDKHITSWAAEQGIEKFTVGKKDVSCELFLNLIVVDEHTCTASATVCWGGDAPKEPKQDAKAKSTPGKKEAVAASVDKAATKQSESKPTESKPVETPKAAEAPKSTTEKAAEAKPADTPATAAVETGAIPVPPAAAATAAAASAITAEPAKVEQATPDHSASVSQATAAAESAAASAERAAAAAERAAQAAERAAAAIAEQTAATRAASASASATPGSTASASSPVAPITPTP